MSQDYPLNNWSISKSKKGTEPGVRKGKHYQEINLNADYDGPLDQDNAFSFNIPSSLAYGVFISQLIRNARACSSDECFYSEGGANFK